MKVAARASRLVAPAGGLALVLFTLEALSRLDIIPRESFPPVTEIFDRLWDLLRTTEYWLTIGRTMRAWAIAMVIAGMIAVPLGLLIGSSRSGYLASKLTIDFLRPIPSVALIPLLVLIYGTRPTLKITLAVIGAVFPLLFQSMYGVRDVDPVAGDTARSFGLSRWQRIRAVVLPTCGPFLLTGLRVSSSIALILVVTGEYIVGIPGVGQATFLAQNSAAYQSMYAWVVTAGIVGLVLNSGFQLVERRTLFWHESQRGRSE